MLNFPKRSKIAAVYCLTVNNEAKRIRPSKTIIINGSVGIAVFLEINTIYK